MSADPPAAEAAPARSWPARIVAAALGVTAVASLGHIIFGLPGTGAVAMLGYIVFALAGIAGQVRRIKVIFAVGVGLTIVVPVLGDAPGSVLRAGFDTAAYLASFLVLLGVLREAAETSLAVRDCGDFLTRQPPGRRYLALHSGGHLLGLLLNFGSLSLLGPMIKKGWRPPPRARARSI